jgi:hypothetical protein
MCFALRGLARRFGGLCFVWYLDRYDLALVSVPVLALSDSDDFLVKGVVWGRSRDRHDISAQVECANVTDETYHSPMTYVQPAAPIHTSWRRLASTSSLLPTPKDSLVGIVSSG